MSLWIDRFLLAALTVVVAVLTATSLPTYAGTEMQGTTLMTHMMASGVLVVGLPVFAIVFLRQFLPGWHPSAAQWVGYLLTLACGLITIATAFACMLPVASTPQMEALMGVHGWAGLLMIPAILSLLAGVRLTRSASRLRS